MSPRGGNNSPPDGDGHRQPFNGAREEAVPRPWPPLFVVAGEATLTVDDSPGEGGSDRASDLRPGNWLMVLPGSVAEVSLRGGFGDITATIEGGTAMRFDLPPADKRSQWNLYATICCGTIHLSKSDQNAPTVGLYYFPRPDRRKPGDKPDRPIKLFSGSHSLTIGAPPSGERRKETFEITNSDVPIAQLGLFDSLRIDGPVQRFTRAELEGKLAVVAKEQELEDAAQALTFLRSFD